MYDLVFIHGWLPFYRKPLFNQLSKFFNVTVVHSGNSAISNSDDFSEVILPVFRVGSFKWQVGLVKTVNSLKPQIVIAGDDLHYLSFIYARLSLRNRARWIWWGVDENKNRLFSLIKLNIIFRPTDDLIFYDRCTYSRLSHLKTRGHKMYVANNTVEVTQKSFIRNFSDRCSFINVGSLVRRKQNDVLIKVFARVLNERGRHLKLYLIGGGDEKIRLQSLAQSLNCTENIIFPGVIEDPSILSNYYSNALASVSFGQAGLAVLQSMAYGVPFITKVDAISGGEICNIEDGKTGILCEDNEGALFDAIVSVIDNPLNAEVMGEACHAYYRDHASLELMVSSFRSALA